MTASTLAPPTTRKAAQPSGEQRACRWWITAIAAVVAASVAHQWLFSTLAEDAFISLRYSAQLVAGNGLVFNPGERVEGYSNFLWVVLVALPGILFGPDVDLVLVARVLGVLSAAAAVVLVAVLVNTVSRSRWGAVVAAALVAASGTFAAYGPSGLETPLFAALVLAALLLVLRERMEWAGLVLAAAVMTRPDGLVVGGVIVVWLLAQRRIRHAAVLVAVAAAPLVAWTIWRVAYYGHIVPNPIAAKAGMDLDWQLQSGWDYLRGFAVATWPMLALTLVAAVVAIAAPSPRAARSSAGLVTGLAVIYIAFFVATGGDWMPAWRFFAPAVPLLAAVVGIGVAGLRGKLAVGAGVVVAAVCVAGLAQSVTNPMMVSRVQLWHEQVRDLAVEGMWLDRALPAGTTIATFANGALSYNAASLNVVDLLGLTDSHIARDGHRDPRGLIGHAAHDNDYVINARRPAVIIDNGAGSVDYPTCSMRADFEGTYTPLLFQLRPGAWLSVLVRTDITADIAARLGGTPGLQPMPCPAGT